MKQAILALFCGTLAVLASVWWTAFAHKLFNSYWWGFPFTFTGCVLIAIACLIVYMLASERTK